MHSIDRLGTSDEAAESASWLSFSESFFVTRLHYAIDGSYTAQ